MEGRRGMAETIYTRLEDRIRKARDDLAGRGSLFGADELDAEYRTFTARFGPPTLAALSDADLLQVMTPGGDHSLPDWLESEGKEHQAFGYPRMSQQHGLGLWFDEVEHCWYRVARDWEYLRDETGHKRVTQSEALDVSRRWRDHLSKAAELLGALPEIAGDSVYLKLQDELEVIAPAVVHEPWAHKYLAMCFPDRLDQFHDPREQRYLLLRCLEMPPRAEDPQPLAYICGGRFSRMARELHMPMNHLCLSLQFLFGGPHAYWLLETSKQEWREFIGQGFIDLGWPQVGELEVRTDVPSTLWKESLWCKLREIYPGTALGQPMAELFWIARQAAPRDVILAHQQGRVLGLADITGPYHYEPDSDHPHQRALRELQVELAGISVLGLPQTPILDLRKHPRVILAVEEALAGAL